MSTTSAPVSQKDAFTKIKEYCYQGEAEIAKILPKEVDPARFLRVSLQAVRKQPLLLNCTPISLLASMLEAARLGLEPTGGMGGAWLVPYGNQAQLIVDYRGLIRLALESGHVLSIEAHLVREGDVFEVERGDRPIFRHVPNFVTDSGRVTAAYAIARFKGGGYSAEIMTTAEIEAIRNRSKAGSKGPWVTDWNEMARKTVVRRLAKYVPMGAKVRRALAIEEEAESSLIPVDSEIVGETKADQVRAKIAARRGLTPPAPVDLEIDVPAMEVTDDAERGVGD